MQIKEDLKQIVGISNFFDSREILAEYGKDHSIYAQHNPDYVVKPVNTQEVQAVVLLANKHKIPVTPVSSGIHFYGNTIPNSGGIILDLGRMNRILDIDMDNKMVRVEPGVTWGQLQTHLSSYNMMALCPLLPHSLKSVLTSHLEREPMLISKYEYAGPLVTSELVFPDGSLFRTGSAAVPGFPEQSLSKGANPGGPGYYSYNWLTQGAQGTLGVVTWAKIKIAPRPKIDKTFFFSFDKLADAVRLVYNIQKRMIGEECLILNNTELATILSARKSLDYARLKDKLSLWTVILVSGGGWRRPEERIEYEEDGIKEAAAELQIAEIPTTLSAVPGIETELPGMLRTAWPENSTYWKFALKGDSQDIFFHTTLDKTEKFVGAIGQIAREKGYSSDDIGYYVQPLEYGRACHFEADFAYNPDDSAELKQIKDLYTPAVTKAMDMGGFFTRPYGLVAQLVFARSTQFTEALKKVKNLFDPNNIMSPGRLSI